MSSLSATTFAYAARTRAVSTACASSGAEAGVAASAKTSVIGRSIDISSRRSAAGSLGDSGSPHPSIEPLRHRLVVLRQIAAPRQPDAGPPLRRLLEEMVRAREHDDRRVAIAAAR